MIRHSIVMICYNQQNYINEALDSVLNEEVKPYEIIVGDDCSSDNTRIILEEYKKKHPDIVKLFFHEKNLGIFGNLNAICKYATGDMVHFLSGDDWFKPKFLAAVNQTIERSKLMPNRSRFILLPEVVLHYPDGTEQRTQNTEKDLLAFTPAGLVLRDKLSWRMVGISRALYDQWPSFEKDADAIGPWADRVHHVLLAQHIEAQYLMQCDGAVYRVGVGIASKTGSAQLQESYLNALRRIKFHYLNGDLALSYSDRRYLSFILSCYSTRSNPSLSSVLGYLGNAIKVFLCAPKDLIMVLKELYFDVRSIKSKVSSS